MIHHTRYGFSYFPTSMWNHIRTCEGSISGWMRKDRNPDAQKHDRCLSLCTCSEGSGCMHVQTEAVHMMELYCKPDWQWNASWIIRAVDQKTTVARCMSYSGWVFPTRFQIISFEQFGRLHACVCVCTVKTGFFHVKINK